jgi:subtilase family serine protease
MSRGLDVFRYTGPGAGLPDLTISRGGIGLSDHTPASGQTVTVTARVRNAGTAATGPVTVRFTDDGALIGERTLAGVPAGGEATTSISWAPAGAGTHELVVTVDPADLVDEGVEKNNAASRNVKVG